MSSHGMAWARKQRTGNPTSKAVLLLIGELVNDEGETTRSQQYIADVLELHVDTVGRQMKALEKAGLLRRERRQASETKRASDRTILQMQPVFEITNPPAEDEYLPDRPSGRPEESPADLPDATPEGLPDGESGWLPDPESGNKDKQLNLQENSLSAAASDDADNPGNELAIPGIAPKTVAELDPDKYIAGKISTWLKDAQSFHAIRGIAAWAIKAYPDMTPDQIGAAMVQLVRNGRPITKLNMHTLIEGYSRVGAVKPSVTEERVAAPMNRAAEYRRQQAEATP
jgi:hypothetical protein